MTQPLPDRCEALRSLLPYLYAHLWSLGKITPKYGDSKPEPGPPSPVWATLDCDGRCPACAYATECRGEGWERVRAYWIRAYRMDEIARAYQSLEPYLECAVRLVYVEPADERSECVSEQAKIMRRRVADCGVEAMARMIPRCIELVAIGERKVSKADQVLAVMERGITQTGRIAKMAGCDASYVRRIKRAIEYAGGVRGTP